MQEEATEQEWMEWFYSNADFGPAHDDVMFMMMEEFEKDTGKVLSDEIKEGY